MYTFAEGQSAHKLVKTLADIMTIIQVSPVSKVYPILSWTFISSSGWWAGLDPKHLPQELWHGFSASWESSICERKLHYPGNRTQNLLLSGEISYHTSVCWVKKTCGHSPLYPSKVGPPWLPTIRLRADTLPHPLGKPRTRGTYPLRDRHPPDGMQSRNPPGVKVEQGAETLA